MDILINEKTDYYELLDSGNGEKLENYGGLILRRPENQAIWNKILSKDKWEKADAFFTHGKKDGRWTKKDWVDEEWKIKLNDFEFNLKLLPSKHLGVFPEQSANWEWLKQNIKSSKRNIKVLNLFAHTGGATLACSFAGAEVVHVDSLKFSIDYAKRNLKDSGMGNNKVRFIIDDVRKFVEREIKRGNKYDLIIMDPPVYGKGTNDKIWKIEDDLTPFLFRVKKLLSEKPLAFLLNGYASVYSSISYKNLLDSVFFDMEGRVSNGELVIKESSGGRLLSSGIFARWER